MANHSHEQDRQSVPVQPDGFPEPPIRRWPHPVDGTEPSQASDPALHYIRCALSYQNQMLADIKALLEQLAPPSEPPRT